MCDLLTRRLFWTIQLLSNGHKPTLSSVTEDLVIDYKTGLKNALLNVNLSEGCTMEWCGQADKLKIANCRCQSYDLSDKKRGD